MRTIRFAFFLLFALAAAACSGAASGGTPAPRASLNGAITLEQIQASSAANALDLVQSLRPQWLRPRGTSRVGQGAPDQVAVYMNNLRMGDLAQLREVSTAQLQSVEYLDGRRAQLRFGNGHEAGVILITPRQ